MKEKEDQMQTKFNNIEYKTEIRKVKDLHPNPDNPRVITKKSLEGLKNSLTDNGYVDRIVVEKDGQIMSGHARWKIFQMEDPNAEIEVLVCQKELTEEERAKALVGLNAQGGEFNIEALQMDFSDIAMRFGVLQDFSGDGDTAEVVEVETPEVTEEEPQAKYGDIYQLGRHRLMCGSATSTADIDQLLDGHKADLVVTDPPYNMNYTGAGNTAKENRKGIMNDNMPEEEFKEFLTEAYKTMFHGMKAGASCYVFYKEMGHGTFITSMEDAGILYKQELIWVKNSLVLGGSKYQGIYEPFLFGMKAGGEMTWNGGRKQTNVIDSVDMMNEEELRKALKELIGVKMDTDIIRNEKTKKNDLHPTMKPIKLLARLIRNSSNQEQIVLDLFAGSGSTLLACEQTNRTCYCTELDPKYVDVIIKRWEEFTGQKATKIK